MGKYFDMLQEDVRVKEGLAACMNCGICTGVCPAASYYDYDPRQIVNIVQTQDDAAIEKLMRSDLVPQKSPMRRDNNRFAVIIPYNQFEVLLPDRTSEFACRPDNMPVPQSQKVPR